MKGDARWRWRNKMQHDNLPENKRHPGEEVDKKWWHVTRQKQCIKRIRGGGGATAGVTQQQAKMRTWWRW